MKDIPSGSQADFVKVFATIAMTTGIAVYFINFKTP
jgi:hypothetical protein